MRIVNYTDARNNLKAVLDGVVNDALPALITRRDAPDVVVISKENYDSIMETLYLLQSPKNAARLAAAVQDAREIKIPDLPVFALSPREISRAVDASQASKAMCLTQAQEDFLAQCPPWTQKKMRQFLDARVSVVIYRQILCGEDVPPYAIVVESTFKDEDHEFWISCKDTPDAAKEFAESLDLPVSQILP